MRKAQARHILVSSKTVCAELLKDLNEGRDFEELASDFSECPSSHSGGDLGEFFEGDMVREFNDAVFQGKVGQIIGPLKTQFGYHIIEIMNLQELESNES